MDFDLNDFENVDPRLIKGEASFQILIIDDDKMIQSLFRNYLESWGFNVINVYDPFEGVANAIRHRPILIILDIFMPELDGEKLLKLLKIIDMTSNIPIIIVSANLNMDILSSTYKHGASGFLSKPFTQKDLFEQIKKVISPALFKRMKLEGINIPDFNE